MKDYKNTEIISDTYISQAGSPKNDVVISNVPQIFVYESIAGRKLYLGLFRKLPNTFSVKDINTAKAITWLMEEYSENVVEITTSQYVKWNGKTTAPMNSTIILNDEMLIETSLSNWVVYFPQPKVDLAMEIIQGLRKWRYPKKKRPFEMYLIVASEGELTLKSVPITPTRLDLTLFYNDDFQKIDALVRKELGGKAKKGLILFHGAPGTGKTTYLRHLIGKLKKRVLYLPPGMANQLVDPGFIEVLIDNPDSVLVIEDAETIIRSRKSGGNPSIANLLNVADGLLSDSLNIQIICTFNQPVSDIDSALLRKGRLIARYEFTPLTTAKAQRLSDHFGNKSVIPGPMTIAEIAQQSAQDFTIKPQQIGFRTSQALVSFTEDF